MKILALTSIRSDYDLLYPLYKLLHDDKDIDFRLLVSGAHLSKTYGYTKKHIEHDQFNILCEIESLIDSDSLKSRIKSASIFLQNSIDIVSSFKPNLLIYAGDREDIIMGALLGIYLNIPTIHFYGGDHELDGHSDTYIRHAVSKLSTLHFVSIEEHKKRLIRIGENPNRIFVIGSISLDRLKLFNEISIDEINKHFGTAFNNFAIVIYHPIDRENPSVFKTILDSLLEMNIQAFVSYPNTDPGNKEIINIIETYKNFENFVFYKNLDRNIFLSIYKKSKFIIGNSSSGIYEAASFKIPAINVGLRQYGRYADRNVIFCSHTHEDIKNAIKQASSKDFLKSLKYLNNSYGDGNSAIKAYNLIKKLDYTSFLPKIEDPLNIKFL
jgi:UDP-N-acetylglucosamine 2-epimerase (non-hydrolysing)/GDP/UDP-N,N'-diacetylbacillosamine 2-epimerase (hydrolysing)